VRLRFALALPLAAAALLPAPAGAQGTAGITGPVDAAPTLDLRYAPRGLGRLAGTQRIEFTNAGSTALGTVWLRLWANGPDGCRQRRITVRLTGPARAGRLRSGCTALPVRLATPLEPGARTALDLRWTVRGRPDPDRFGRFGTTVLLGNVVPLLAVTAATASTGASPTWPPARPSTRWPPAGTPPCGCRARCARPPPERRCPSGSAAHGGP